MPVDFPSRLTNLKPTSTSSTATIPPGSANRTISDITFIDTEEGWLYLTVIEDMWSRCIVGYAITDHMRAEAVIEALQMALRR